MERSSRHYWHMSLGVIVALVCVRVVALGFSDFDLHGDEAQYFAWSRELAGGYFSKPPLIAWVIRASTELFGTGEWAIRMWSPIVHGLAALCLFRAGERLVSVRVGFWTALAYLTLPGIVVSSAIASTDALLLLCVALMIWAWSELREGGPNLRWTLVLALALGAGFLSKYAMLFMAMGLGLNWLFDTKTRAAIPLSRGCVVSGVVALMLLPNLLWNLANDFATATHTAANANLQAELLNPLEGLEFLFSQLGVMGPVLFVLLGLSIMRAWRDATLRALLIFTAVPLLIILVQAFLSRANANWAASAYVPGTLLVVAVWLRSGWDWLKAGVGVNALVAALLTVISLSPALTDALGLANSVKRVRGWDATVQALSERARETGATTIAVDNRITFYALDYYGLGEVAPLHMWQMEASPHNHAELTRGLPEDVRGPILFVNYHDEHRDRVEGDFENVRPLPRLRVPLGGGIERKLDLYVMEGYRRAPRATGTD